MPDVSHCIILYDQAKIIQEFNSTIKYLETSDILTTLLNIVNFFYEGMINQIYSLEINNLEIEAKFLHTMYRQN